MSLLIELSGCSRIFDSFGNATKTATSMYYYMKIVDDFQSEIRILNVCKSNSNSNFKNEVQNLDVCFTCLVFTMSVMELL